jgi:8-oxo-dGTP pyrophosphatase MutT (NUDIX family)
MPDKTSYEGIPNQIRPSVAAVIFNEDARILLQQRGDNGYWGLPGGSVELGETVEAAVLREVREETGYEVEIVRLVGVYSDPQHTVVHYPDGNVVQYISCLFECRIVRGTPALSEETIALDWFVAGNLPDLFVPHHRQRVQDACARQAEAFYR